MRQLRHSEAEGVGKSVLFDLWSGGMMLKSNPDPSCEIPSACRALGDGLCKRCARLKAAANNPLGEARLRLRCRLGITAYLQKPDVIARRTDHSQQTARQRKIPVSLAPVRPPRGR